MYQASSSYTRFRTLLLACWCMFPLTSAYAAPEDSKDENFAVWEIKTNKSPKVVWQAHLGSDSGSPVVYQGRVLVGSNNFIGTAPPKEDKAALLCFDQVKGGKLWQTTYDRLAQRAHDIPTLGLLNRVACDGTQVFVQNNRGELLCYEQNEKLEAKDPKLIWKLDFVTELDVFKRDAGDIGNPLPTPLVIDDLVYCVTGNGSTFGYQHVFGALPFVPKPDAPSFVAIQKKTGKVVWSSSAPGKQIAYAQWGSPVATKLGDKIHILFPGGDGCLYLFDPLKGTLLGKVNCNPQSKIAFGHNQRGDKTFFLSAPTVSGEIAYVGLNQDMETPQGVACPVVAVNLQKLAEGKEGSILWSYIDNTFDGVVGPVAVCEDCVFAMSRSGMLVCLDKTTGKSIWHQKFENTARFSGPVQYDGKLYASTTDSLNVFTPTRKKRFIGRYEFDEVLMGMPSFGEKKLFVATNKFLWCLQSPE